MSLNKTYTIFRSEQMKKRTDAGLVPFTHVTKYPGSGRNPDAALDSVLEDTATNESDLLSEMPLDDPDYDMELSLAMDRLTGDWTVFAGKHASPPKDVTPLLTA